MANLADDIVTHLAAQTWSTISEPTLTTKTDKQAELTLGTGWVWSGTEDKDPCYLGSSIAGKRTTPFEIFIACATEANKVLYQTNIETFIHAKTIAGGWWAITKIFNEDTGNRHIFHCAGEEVIWST
jgi:hypothetical protein